MHLAFDHAMNVGFDYYLWLNDDVELFPNALTKLIAMSSQMKDRSIIVGSVQDLENKQLTYGGVSRLDPGRPLKFTLIQPTHTPLRVETMNGNCVLIPEQVASTVGNLDTSFTHRMGDFDYGLQAMKKGIETFIAPGFYGYCQLNPLRERWKDLELPFAVRWKHLVSPHGLQPREWAIFAKRYAGPLWPLFWLSPYLHMILSSVFHRPLRNGKVQ